MKTIVAMLALGLASLAFAQEQTAAQEQTPKNMPKFETIDANKDGMISKEEATKVEGLNFAAVDTNHDGLIDRAEYTKAFG